MSTADRLTQLSAEQIKALSLRLKKRRTEATKLAPPLVRAEHDGRAPLSFAQQRLWFLQQLEPHGAAYNVPLAVRLTGALDVAALRSALTEVVRRHEVLRTTFPAVGGEPVQLIHKVQALHTPLVDLTVLPATWRERAAAALVAAEAAQPFDLSAGPLLRARLLRLSGQEHVLTVVLHHIVSDGWSAGVLVSEFTQLYEAARQGQPSPLSELPVQYADYSIWQRGWLQGEALEAQLGYWRRQLEGLERLELAGDKARAGAAATGGAAGVVRFEVSAEVTQRLRVLSRAEGVTLFMTLLAGFQLLLSRYTGRSDVAVGTDVAGRGRVEVEGLIGFFVNQLVLRTQVGGCGRAGELLGRVREAVLGAYAHQEVPFERLVEELAPDRAEGSPLFSSKLILQNVPEPEAAVAGIAISSFAELQPIAKLDLHLAVDELPANGGLACVLTYARERFGAGLMSRLTADYVRALEFFAWSQADAPLSGFDFDEAARRQALALACGETLTVSGTVVEWVEECAAARPSALALAGSGPHFTYAQLSAQSSRLAAHLRALGVGPETRVALHLGSSTLFPLAVLAVWKAGGAYLPLDPSHPAERLAALIEDSGAALLITHSSLRAGLPAHWAVELSLDEDWAEVEARPAEWSGPAPAPRSLAYIIYTSGSTGGPKGVMVEQAQLADYVRAAQVRLGLDAGLGCALVSTPAADLGHTVLYPALAAGATLHVLGEEVARDGEAAGRYLRERGVGCVKLTPSHLRAWLGGGAEGLGLRKLVLGGEALTGELVARARELAPVCEVWNHYGPTETTVGVAAGLAQACGGEQAALGRPLANRRLYVLDGGGRVCPVGVYGELYIGGAGVARGYVNRPGLTAERFLPDPFSAEAGARLYRTGDVVRWREDGELEFLGRADRQVKLRGYRVELGEVEAALARHAGVQQCAVEVREVSGAQTLVAYVSGAAEAGELREYLSERLPSYMVPQRYVRMEALPLTPNGKLDRKRLPEVAAGGEEGAGHEEPRTVVEELVAGVWAEVLGLSRVGLGEDFFALGGHSLLAAQVVARLRVVFGVEVGLRTLFERPTVGGVAGEVERLREAGRGGEGAASPLVRAAHSGRARAPLSFAQQRLWFLHQLEPLNPAYNSPRIVRLGGALDYEALRSAFGEVVRRHEVLRTTFPTVEGEPVQLIHPPQPVPVPVADLSGLEAQARARVAQALAEAEAARPFALSSGPVLRVRLLRLAEAEHVLVVVLHHIVSDAWSTGVLVREFTQLYEAARQGQPSPLEELPVQYADYAVWQRGWLQGEALEAQLGYWRRQLEGLERLELPADGARAGASRAGAVRVEVSAELAERLRALSRAQGTTLFMTLLAGFQLLLSRYAGQRDVAVGTAMANRDRVEVEGLVGFFLNQLVLRARVGECATVTELLGQVREVVLGAYAHQELPFERLVEEIATERDLSSSPLFQVMFLYERRESNSFGLTELADSTRDVEHRWAKFDLTLMAEDTPAGLDLRLEYAADLFRRPTAERFARSLRLILETMAARPDCPLSQVPILDDAEAALLTTGRNLTRRPYDSRLVHEFFESQAADAPERPAVTCGHETLTYAELNARADSLAARLVELGAGPECRVAVCAERGFELLTALLAVLKSGAAYVPLDPQYPRARVSYILEDSGAALLLTQRHLLAFLPECGLPVVYVDETGAGGARERCVPANTAYVIYTSGSTGQPKGVAVTHDNVANFFAGMDDAVAPGAAGKWLAVTTVSFDISVLELFWTLARGFEVVFPSWVETPSRDAGRASMAGALDFSLFYFAAEDESGGETYRLLLEGAKFADRHGFSAVWTPERHFHEFGGIYPNPALTSASVASVTQNIGIRSGSVVLPLHHPVTVAEDWAVVDNLSGGRAGVSFASGWHAADFVLAPDSYAERKAVMFRNIEIVRALWRGETIRLTGGAGKEVDVRIHPRPVQPEIPIWLTAAGNPETFRAAGQVGLNVLTHMLGQSVEELAERVRLYREARRESGHEGPGHVTVMVHTFVAPDAEVIRERVRGPFVGYLRQSLDLVRAFGRAIGVDVDAQGFAEEDMEALLAHAADRFMDSASMIGTPEKCVEMAAQLKAAGADEIACLIDFGIDFETTMEGLRLLDKVRLAANRPPTHAEPIPSVIREQQITHLQCTPSLARMIITDARADDLSSLRALCLGGEAFPGALATELRESYGGPIFNMYGPTETTIWSSVKPVVDEVSGTLPISGPIANTQLYVLDAAGRLCPVGVHGELYIGGAGVARGYINRPGLTAERFLPDPFSAETGARLYRTGDVVRWREDGQLEFLGRADRQVKLRGYRVELGEVEAALARHAGVLQCAVEVREVAGTPTLVAYVEGEAGAGELREYLSERLPSYMVPQRYVRLDALPLTPNGKLDRKRLPEVAAAGEEGAGHEEPRTPVEELVAGVWCEVLGLERVGLGEDFFEIGGHSLLATQVVARLRGVFGVEVGLRVLFESPTVEGVAAEVQRLTSSQSGGALPPLTHADRDEHLPLSFGQQRLWFIDRLEPGNPAYNSPRVLRLEGDIDYAALRSALTEVVRRHEVLRTTFPTVEGEPVQLIHPSQPVPVPVVDLSGLGEQARERAAQALAEAEASRPFNLSAGPVLRARLLLVKEGEHVLVVVLHHVVSDGWSTGVLVREFTELYEAFRRGRPSPLRELPVQYADYAVWQRGWLQGEVLEAQLAYWRTQLEGLEPLQLLTDRPRTNVVGRRLAGWHSFRWSTELVQRLNAFSRREGVTLYMTLLAVFAALLSHYTGQDDIAVGTDVANRTLLETEGLIGFFINQLVLRTRVAPGMSFREMLRSVRETTLDGYAHQELPFEKLVEELAPERHLDRSPLFQVKLILQNAPQSDLVLGDIRFSEVPIQQPEARFDLVLSLVESPDGIGGNVEYAAGLYDEATVALMMEHLRVLLESVMAEPDAPVRGASLTGAAERDLVLTYGAGVVDEGPTRGPVHERFLRQALSTPHAPAVLEEGRPYLYLELETRANRLAHYLRNLGVGPDVRVALLLERGFDLAVAVLGVLKAGGAYVPLNRAWPVERIAHVLDDAAVPVVLTHERLRNQLPVTWAQVVALDVDWPDVAVEDAELPEVESHPEALAYVIYTSGSTGQPKGVMVSHAALAARISALSDMYRLTPDDRVLQFVSPSFDPFGLEFFPGLSGGAAVAFEPGITEMSGLEIARLSKQRKITVSLLLPAQLEEVTAAVRAMPESERPRLRLLLSGGDSVSAAGVSAWQSTFGVPTLHQYGPTEATILASAYACDGSKAGEQDAARGILGRPIANTRLYVLGEAGQLCPVGVPGELYVGGAGLARGYVNRPFQTAERFVPDPFGAEPGARLYRTGDLVRWRKDGQLEFLGRADQQLKLRGYRIEPGEIEATLARHPDVVQCAVVVREVAGTPALVAYVSGVADAETLREYLTERLPSYMVPQRVMTLETLPLTANGKIDRRALPEPQEVSSRAAAYVPPRTPTEETLCGIWAEVLGLERVGLGENFFRLGGHSLLVTQVVSRVRATFGVEVPLRALFESPVVEAVAPEVERLMRATDSTAAAAPPPLVRAEHGGRAPLSFAQQRLWFLQQLEPHGAAYNVPLAVRLTGVLDVAALRGALTEVVRRHEVLRTTFPTVEGEPVQLIHPSRPVPVPVVDLSGLGAGGRERMARVLAEAEAARPFDLSAGPLLRARLLRLSGQEHVLTVVLHHIVSDGWSAGVLVSEFTQLYEAARLGQPSPLEELPVQYADYSIWQRGWLQGEVLEAQLGYWREQLAGLERLELPADGARSGGAAAGVARFEVGGELTARLRALSGAQGGSLFMTLLAAYKALLHYYARRDDIAVGVDIVNRSRPELEGLIGFFINILVMRSDLSGDPTIDELLGRVRKTATDAYAHQELNFERLVEELRPDRSSGGMPLVQTIFSFRNPQHTELAEPSLAVSPFGGDEGAAKRDLTLFMTETEAGLVGSFTYDSSLFRAGRIERMAEHFLLLLEKFAERPDARLAEALSAVAESERLRAEAGRKQRRSARLQQLVNVTPKAVSLSEVSLVRTDYLTAGEKMPLVIRPALDDVDLSEWARGQRQHIEAELLKHGAILFRGFEVASAGAFEQVALALCPELFGEYGDLPRDGVGGKVYGSTPYPADRPILFHNESSHLHRWPMKIWFYCARPAARGGETPIVDCRRVYQYLDPKIRERFAERGLMYVRNYVEGLDVSWQDFFRTSSRAEVEAQCRRAGVAFEWTGGGGLRTRQTCRAVAQHPSTGEYVFFNQMQAHHVSCLEPATRESLLAMLREEELPRNVYYGDGSPIEDSVVAEVRELYERLAVNFPWQAGDILMLDNMLAAHGRNPYQGERKILVALGEMTGDHSGRGTQNGGPHDDANR